MNNNTSNNTGAGKGDRPRNCFSKQFKDNYDAIDWGKKKRTEECQIKRGCGGCKKESCPNK